MGESNVFHMDCMQGMKQFPDKFFDLAVVDPPYGINITGLHKAKQNQSALVGGGAELSAVTGSYGKGRPPIGGGNSQGRIKKLKIESTFLPCVRRQLHAERGVFQGAGTGKQKTDHLGRKLFRRIGPDLLHDRLGQKAAGNGSGGLRDRMDKPAWAIKDF